MSWPYIMYTVNRLPVTHSDGIRYLQCQCHHCHWHISFGVTVNILIRSNMSVITDIDQDTLLMLDHYIRRFLSIVTTFGQPMFHVHASISCAAYTENVSYIDSSGLIYWGKYTLYFILFELFSIAIHMIHLHKNKPISLLKIILSVSSGRDVATMCRKRRKFTFNHIFHNLMQTDESNYAKNIMVHYNLIQ